MVLARLIKQVTLIMASLLRYRLRYDVADGIIEGDALRWREGHHSAARVYPGVEEDVLQHTVRHPQYPRIADDEIFGATATLRAQLIKKTVEVFQREIIADR